MKDFYVIKNDLGWSDYSRKWHIWGAIQNALAVAPLMVILCMWDFELGRKLCLIIFLLFWQLHDSILGWKFYRRPFYLGNHGLDRWLEQVFQNGVNVFIIRITIVLLTALEYFRISHL